MGQAIGLIRLVPCTEVGSVESIDEREGERQRETERTREGGETDRHTDTHLSPEPLCILEAVSAALAYLTLQPEGSLDDPLFFTKDANLL